MFETMAVAAWLLDDQHTEAAMIGRAGFGAGEHHEDVGSPCEGAPGLDAIDEPTSVGAGSGRHPNPGCVTAVVGLGDGDGSHDLTAGQSGEPGLLLVLRAACDEGPGQDLRSSDE